MYWCRDHDEACAHKATSAARFATYYANLPPKNNRQIIAKRINQKKTSEFANADSNRKYGPIGFVSPKKNEKVVYQFDSMLLPVYANFTYNITIFTQFQQQMNELLQPFLSRTGSTRYFLINRYGYKYECFIEPNFETKNNVAAMEEEERRYITNITIIVYFYYITMSKWLLFTTAST